MAARSNVPHVLAKFFTKQPQYAIDEAPFSVPSDVSTDQLQKLVNGLLKSGGDGGSESPDVQFDFLIDGVFLTTSLEIYVQQHDISTETVLSVEYVERRPAPAPEDSLLHDDWVAAVRAHEQYILTGCYDNTLRLWDTAGKALLTIPGHTAPVKCVAWLQQEEGAGGSLRFVTGSHDETVLTWRWSPQRNSVECVHACRGHAASVDCVAVSPSAHRFCSGSWDTMLKIWSADITEGEENVEEEQPSKKRKKDGTKILTRVPLMTLSGHKEGVSAALWLDEAQVCTASWDHTIRLWDIESAAQKSTIAGNKVFLDVAYSPLSKLLVAASSDRHVRLYDPRVTDGAVVLSTFTSHTAWVSGVAWSPTHEHQFVSGSYDGVLKLWDTRSPQVPLYDMTGHEDKIMAVDWSIPTFVLSGGADNNLKIFRVSEDKK